jgi:hypothetical protein
MIWPWEYHKMLEIPTVAQKKFAFISFADPGLSTHLGSRIQGSKRHRISDPDPQHWHLPETMRRAK